MFWLSGCATAGSETNHETQPAPTAETPAATGQTPTPTTAETGANSAPGRLAFTQCDADKRPEVCTEQFDPVCGEVDNGVRCIRAPCPSTDRREFGNACAACADKQTVGYWPVPCSKLDSGAPTANQ